MLEVQYHNTDKQKKWNEFLLDMSQKNDIGIIAGLDSHYIYPEESTERDNLLEARGIHYEDENDWYMDYPDDDTTIKRFKKQGILSAEQIRTAMNNTNILLDFEDYDDVPIFNKEIKLPTLYPGETKEQKEIKESKEDKYMCSSHGNRYTGYCFSCKKNMCKKCFKRGHKKRKIYSNILLSEKNLNDLNKHLNQCQESLNKFENKVHLLIEELNNKERNEKIILNIMSKAYIDMNKENLKEIKDTIKTYVNCVKKSMLNYETIMNVKNLEFKNVITIPKDIFELIKIFKNYKNHIVYKNMNKKSTSENDDKDKENKYIQLFEAFFNVLKKYENNEINFKEIVENEDYEIRHPLLKED